MTRRVPFNIYSIRDIDEWRRDFFYPVSSEVSDLINEQVCVFLADQFGRVRDALKVYYRIASKALYIETYNLLLKAIIAFRMKENRGCEFVLSNHRVPGDVNLAERNIAYELYRGSEDVPFPDLRLEYDDRYYRAVPGWKKLAKRVVQALNRGRFPRPGNSRRALVMGPNDCTWKYVKSQFKDSSCLLYPELIFRMPSSSGSGPNREADFGPIADELGKWVDTFFHEVTAGRMSQRILKDYRNAVRDLFNRGAYDLEQARSFCRKLPLDVEMYTGTAKHFVRVMSEAMREKGAIVTGFPHEGGLSGLYMPYLAYSEFATCDRFVCFDRREADDYGKYTLINDVDFPAIPELGESILNMDAGRFRKGPKIDLSKVTTIMYLNYSYWYDNYAYGTRSDLQGLDLHLRLIEFLLKIKKRIIFKLRPKTAYLSQNYRHFGYFGNRIEYNAEPFTQLLDKADLFILEGVGSTALYEAMTLTRKPIILFKAAVPGCTPSFEEMINKRCHVVDLYEDDRNRLCFDEKKLAGILGINP